MPDYFKNNIQDVSPTYWRLQAALIKTEGSSILIINSYFPVDPRTVKIDENELNEGGFCWWILRFSGKSLAVQRQEGLGVPLF